MKMGNRVSTVSLLAVVLAMGFLPNVFSSEVYDTSPGNHEIFVLKPEILLSQSTQTSTTGSGSIEGTVKDYDSDAGISGATVATDTGGYSTTTKAYGSYKLSNVAEGTYSLTASKNGYESSTFGVGVGSGSASFLNFTLKRSSKIGSITGNVTDGTGSGISGATVSTDTDGYSTTTDANGSYTLSNVSTGTYTLTAYKVGYNSESDTTAVTEGETSVVDFTLTRVPTPTPSPSPIVTLTLPPFPSPPPTLTPTPTIYTIQATVDIQGKTINLNSTRTFFAKIRLPSGYDIDDIRCKSVECEGAKASKCEKDKKEKKKRKVYFNIQELDDLDVDDNETKMMELTVTGELTDGTPFTGSDMAKVKGKKGDDGDNGTGRIDGRVSSDNGPLEGATVTIENKSFRDERTTDASGDFSFENLAWGRYKVTAEKEGYETKARAPKLSEKHNYRNISIKLQEKK